MPAATPSQIDRLPIILVHGLKDTSRKMRHITHHLRERGWQVFDLDLTPSNGDAKLEVLAQQLADFIDRTFPPQQPIDLLGYSMGGMVCRYYLQRLGGLDRTRRFVTIAAPHHGTIAAHFSLKPGCMQMRPDSEFMHDLNTDLDRLSQLAVTSLWTPYDLIILPPTSSQLNFGTNLAFPVAMHPLMVSDRHVLDAIATALSQPISQGERYANESKVVV
jgi:triacylglycerol lipase